MNKVQFASALNFPSIWLEAGLLPDELFDLQVGELLREYGGSKPDGGTEHWRYGAFLYWLKKDLDFKTLDALFDAAFKDPDPSMAGNVIKELVTHTLCTESLLQRAAEVVSTSKDYYVTRAELESTFAGARGKKR
jgi:hypothetical protein